MMLNLNSIKFSTDSNAGEELRQHVFWCSAAILPTVRVKIQNKGRRLRGTSSVKRQLDGGNIFVAFLDLSGESENVENLHP